MVCYKLTRRRSHLLCEIVLVFLKTGVFCELHKITTPTATVTSASTSVLPTLRPVIPQNAEQQ